MSKVTIAGNASGTGVFTITSPNSNTDRTLTLPDSAGALLNDASSLAAANLTGTIAKARLPAGSVLQVVSATKTDAFSCSGTGFSDVPGLSVSITPTSNTSKILIICSVNGQGAVSSSFLATKLVRNSTDLAIGDAYSSAARVTSSTGYTQDSGGQLNLSMTYLDSPATTSATTYKVQASSLHGSSAFINRSQQDDGSYTRVRTASTITVMEIAA